MREWITWNWLRWRVIRCRGEEVKEGDEEWEGTWEKKREMEMKEWQLGTIMYIDDRPDKRRIRDGAHFTFLGSILLSITVLAFHMIDCPACHNCNCHPSFVFFK